LGDIVKIVRFEKIKMFTSISTKIKVNSSTF
jgi:hypothetical protein